MNDKTRIRIKVPAHLYESVKKQLALKEGKSDFSGGAYTQPVKEKKNVGDKPKSESAPKKESSQSRAIVNEKEPKTVEERLNTLEGLMKELMKEKKMMKKESEKDQSYEKGKQNPKIEEEDSEEEE